MYCQSWMNCAAVPLLHQNQPFGWYSWNGAHNTGTLAFFSICSSAAM